MDLAHSHALETFDLLLKQALTVTARCLAGACLDAHLKLLVSGGLKLLNMSVYWLGYI